MYCETCDKTVLLYSVRQVRSAQFMYMYISWAISCTLTLMVQLQSCLSKRLLHAPMLLPFKGNLNTCKHLSKVSISGRGSIALTSPQRMRLAAASTSFLGIAGLKHPSRTLLGSNCSFDTPPVCNCHDASSANFSMASSSSKRSRWFAVREMEYFHTVPSAKVVTIFPKELFEWPAVDCNWWRLKLHQSQCDVDNLLDYRDTVMNGKLQHGTAVIGCWFVRYELLIFRNCLLVSAYAWIKLRSYAMTPSRNSAAAPGVLATAEMAWPPPATAMQTNACFLNDPAFIGRHDPAMTGTTLCGSAIVGQTLESRRRKAADCHHEM